MGHLENSCPEPEKAWIENVRVGYSESSESRGKAGLGDWGEGRKQETKSIQDSKPTSERDFLGPSLYPSIVK